MLISIEFIIILSKTESDHDADLTLQKTLKFARNAAHLNFGRIG
jgi:hypothetical protein